jgi:hypothetical protein
MKNIIDMGRKVVRIQERAFHDLQLTSVTIPDSITTLEYGAFAHNQLTSVTIPASVETIGNHAFSHNQIRDITIPETVKSIATYAFWKDPLESVTVQAALPADKVGWAVFDSLTPAFMANGRKPGVYVKGGPFRWTHDGKPLPEVAALATN